MASSVLQGFRAKCFSRTISMLSSGSVAGISAAAAVSLVPRRLRYFTTRRVSRSTASARASSMRSSVFSARMARSLLRSMISTVCPLFSTVTVTCACASSGKNLSSFASLFSAFSIKLGLSVTRRPVHVTFIGQPPFVLGAQHPCQKARCQFGFIFDSCFLYLYYSKSIQKVKMFLRTN